MQATTQPTEVKQTEKRRWFARKPKAEQPKAEQPLIVPTMPDLPVSTPRTRLQAIGHNLYTWRWTKSLVYWLILSCGTASDLIFIIATVWISENANVHIFLTGTLHMSQEMTDNLTSLATTMYIALPVFIVFLAMIETVEQLKLWKYDHWAKLWTILFGIPAVIFFMLDFVTLSYSVANSQFTMPTFFVVLRADCAFIYASASLIHHFIGEPQEAKRLALKDQQLDIAHQNMLTISREHAEQITRLTAEWQTETARLTAELNALKQRLAGSISQLNAAQSELNKSSESALEAYGDECVAWLKSGIKTANIEEITKFTGHTKRKIANAIERGNLQTSTRNKALVLVGSLIQWLAENAPKQSDTGPILHIVNAD